MVASKLIVQGVGIPHPLIFPKPFQEPFPVIVSWQPVPADAAQAGDTSSSPGVRWKNLLALCVPT